MDVFEIINRVNMLLILNNKGSFDGVTKYDLGYPKTTPLSRIFTTFRNTKYPNLRFHYSSGFLELLTFSPAKLFTSYVKVLINISWIAAGRWELGLRRAFVSYC